MRNRWRFLLVNGLLGASLLLFTGCSLQTIVPTTAESIDHESLLHLGVRPLYLISQMTDSPLRTALEECQVKPMQRHSFSIAHRGAPLQFPEHSRESYVAAIQQGAGILECDVTFTADQQLVCRHSQCDLHQTTDILLRPELAKKCAEPFRPATASTAASARCCTSDITLAEFKTLCAKMDGVNSNARHAQEFVQGTPHWRTDLYSQCGEVMSHADSVALFQQYGVGMTPELKEAEVDLPFQARASDQPLTQSRYAQQLVDELRAAQVDPKTVWLQSFDWQDVLYWLAHTPEFAPQVIWLDGRYDDAQFDAQEPSTWQPTMAELRAAGLHIIAPPLWKLVREDHGRIVPSRYAEEARAAGLDIIAWTVERSGRLSDGGGWYYQTLPSITNHEGVVFELLDVLAQDIGVQAVFSDWPATTTYYANCRLPN